MKEIIISKKYNEKKIINVLLSEYPSLNMNLINKTLRKKDIKINNNRINKNTTVYEGDVILIYLSDIYFNPQININIKDIIIFEDENILVINKPVNLCIQKDKENEICLLDLLQNNYSCLYPCHRLDRNTSGLVILAKNEQTLKELLICFKNRLIDKHYKCLVYGIMEIKEATLKAYLYKDSIKSKVLISDKKLPDYELIKTHYSVIKENIKENISLLEVNLITGKTHQIRAHLAHIGYPIIGDGKYGINKINKQFNKKNQCLTSYKIVFHTETLNTLKYLDNKVIEIKSTFI